MSQSQDSLSNFAATAGFSDSGFFGIATNLASEAGIDYLISQLCKYSIYPHALINNARSLSYLTVPENGVVSRENFIGEYLLDVVVPYELTGFD